MMILGPTLRTRAVRVSALTEQCVIAVYDHECRLCQQPVEPDKLARYVAAVDAGGTIAYAGEVAPDGSIVGTLMLAADARTVFGPTMPLAEGEWEPRTTPKGMHTWLQLGVVRQRGTPERVTEQMFVDHFRAILAGQTHDSDAEIVEQFLRGL